MKQIAEIQEDITEAEEHLAQVEAEISEIEEEITAIELSKPSTEVDEAIEMVAKLKTLVQTIQGAQAYEDSYRRPSQRR